MHGIHQYKPFFDAAGLQAKLTALGAVLEPLLESGKAHVRGADTLIVSD